MVRRATRLVLCLSVVAGACGGGGRSGQGDTLTSSLTEPAFIDPVNVQDSEGYQVTRLVFDGLTDVDSHGQVIPATAEKWTVSRDNRVFTFTLRADAKFQNGRPVKADDFVYAFNRVANPRNASEVAYQGNNIMGWQAVQDGKADTVVGVKAVDDRTLEITAEEPFALLPKVLTHAVFSPVPKEELDTPAEARAFATHPIGNGPYKMDGDWKHKDHIRLTRFGDYYGTPGTPKAIDFRIFATIATERREVSAGHLDVGRVETTNLDAARREFGPRLIEQPIAALDYIGLPTDKGAFRKTALREALALAIDTTAINHAVLNDAREVATGVVPSLAPGARAGACPSCRFDPVAAKQRYRAAGGLPGNTTTLSIASGDEAGQQIAEAIANDWHTHLGITTRIDASEFATFIDKIDAGLDGPWLTSWVWDYPSAYSFLGPLLSTGSADNDGGWSNSAFDAALAGARTAPSEDAGLSFLATAQTIAGAEMPLIPVFFSKDVRVASKRVIGLRVDVAGYPILERASVSN